MNTITIERELLEQALGALVRAEMMYGQPNQAVQAALRAELAKPVEQAEPVAWLYSVPGHRSSASCERIPLDMTPRGTAEAPLYLHPPTPAWHDTPGVVWKATSLTGDTAHFGVRSAAKAWARSGTVEPVPLKHLRLVPLGTDCGPECRQCGMTCLRARQIDEQFAHRLSLAVEAMLIDPERNRTFAEKQLGEYEAAWAAINPGPATSMGEPVTSMGALANPKFLPGSPVEDYSDCHGPDWTERDGEYLK